mgnify:CR=1 FL=1
MGWEGGRNVDKGRWVSSSLTSSSAVVDLDPLEVARPVRVILWVAWCYQVP